MTRKLAASLLSCPLAVACVFCTGITEASGRAEGQAVHAATAPAATPDAATLNERGEALYLAGKYDEAVVLFRRAYQLEPEPTLLYNEALALEKAKRYTEAVVTLEAYLKADPDAPDRPALEARVGTLRALVDTLAAEKQAQQRALPQPQPTSSWLLGPAPWLIGGVGAAGLGVGAVLGVLALGRHDSAQQESVQLTAIERQSEAESLALGSTIAFVAGGALLATGSTLLIFGLLEGDDSSASSGASNVNASVAFGLGSVSIRGVF